MAKLGVSVLVFLFILYFHCRAESVVAGHSKPNVFIRVSCMATHYPALCLHCLSGYPASILQNDHQLARTALSVSLDKARSAVVFVYKLSKFKGMKRSESLALRDCINNMGHSVNRLAKSIKELNYMDKAAEDEFLWHTSNVQTWVSAALTDENTCLYGFAGHVMDGHVKLAIQRRIINVAQVTSNALALVNRFAEKRRINRNP